MSESIRIAVAMHKPYRTPDDPAYLPLHVGAALHPDVLPGIQGDDEGDNISRLNASYSELTALYCGRTATPTTKASCTTAGCLRPPVSRTDCEKTDSFESHPVRRLGKR